MIKAKSQKIAVVGVGMVGGALKRYLEEEKGYVRNGDLFLFDVDPKKGFSDDPNRADVIFITVPSPSCADGRADTSYVQNALDRIESGKVAVIKSTVPPGT